MYMKIISMYGWRWMLGLCTALALGLAGCTTASGGSGGGDDRVDVVAAFYPFQFLAERVGGPDARVSSLTAPGAEPHDVELTPRQVASMAEADLIIVEKGFQPAVDEAVLQSGHDNVLDTTTVVPLVTHDTGSGVEEAGAGDDHTHAEEASGPDPHIWLDPTRLATVTRAVADRLAALDPAHAAGYQERASKLIEDLNTLDQQYRDGLAECRRRAFITTHAAFGYLAARYDLEQIAVSDLSPEAEPSPARIAEVQRAAREHGVTTIFYETLVSPAVAESIANDLGLRTDVLDPVEGLTEASRGEDYLAVMNANLRALQTANECR
jgi:zinc transport system substrate-binding protein